jgi:hypothetical protein
MIIDSFERNADDAVVAICGGTKYVLPWSLVIDLKPQIGDDLIDLGDVYTIVKKEDLSIAEVAALHIDEPATPVVDPVEVPVEPVI